MIGKNIEEEIINEMKKTDRKYEKQKRITATLVKTARNIRTYSIAHR